MTTIESVPAFFDALPSRFHADRAQGLHAVYQFDVTGDGGGEWHATIADGRCDVRPGQAASPDITLQAPTKARESASTARARRGSGMAKS